MQMTSRFKMNVILILLMIFAFTPLFLWLVNNVKAEQKLIQRNGYIILMPLIELNAERGDTYVKAIEIHHELLTQAIDEIKNYEQASWPTLIFLKATDVKRLEEIQKELKPQPDRNDNDEAHVRIDNANKTVVELLVELQQYLSNPIIISRRKEIPVEFREKITNALEKSHDKVRNYISGIEKKIAIAESVENAEDACQENRRAICLSLFASLIYQDFFVTQQKKLMQFREDIYRTIYYNNILCKSLSSSEDKVSKDERLFKNENCG